MKYLVVSFLLLSVAIESNAQTRRRKSSDPYRKSELTSDRTEAKADHREIVVGLGVDKLIDIDFDANMSRDGIQIGNTEIVRATAVKVGDQKQLILKALQVGETNITIRDEAGNPKLILDIIATSVNLDRILSDLRDVLLKEVEGIEYRIVGGKVYLLGEVITIPDYGRVYDITTDPRFAANVSNKVTLSPISLSELSKRIEKEVQTIATTVRASVVNKKILLEGTVESAGLKKQVFDRARIYIPEIRPSEPISKDDLAVRDTKPLDLLQDQIVVQEPPPKRESKLVRLTVHFVELSKDFRKVFGFKWQPGFTEDAKISIGQNSTGSVTTAGAGAGGFSFAATLSSLFPVLQSAQDAGYGRILKTANIIAKSGEKGLLKDLQTVYPQTIGVNGTAGTGNPINVGFDVEITPTILAQDNIDLSLRLNQTNRIGNGPNGTPIVAQHEVQSRVYLKSGEVAALAGIDTNDVQTGYNRDDANPGAFGATTTGTTRPLFTLNRSKNFNKRRGQFIVYVSPQLIENASEGTTDLKANFRVKSN
jgi:pilus assembly protein CpaC